MQILKTNNNLIVF